MPTLAELDAAVPDRPVLLYTRFTGPCATNTLGKRYFDAVDAGPKPHPAYVPVNTAASNSALYLLRTLQTYADKLRSAQDMMTYSVSVGLTTHLDQVLFPTPGPLSPTQVLSNLDHYRMYDALLDLHRQGKLMTGSIGEWAAPLSTGAAWFEAQRLVAQNLGCAVQMAGYRWVASGPNDTNVGAQFRTIVDHGIQVGLHGDGVHIAPLNPWPHIYYTWPASDSSSSWRLSAASNSPDSCERTKPSPKQSSIDGSTTSDTESDTPSGHERFYGVADEVLRKKEGDCGSRSTTASGLPNQGSDFPQ